jgi:serralysin
VGSGAATLSDFNAKASSIETWAGNGQGLFGTSAANVFDFSGLTAKPGLPFVDGLGGNDKITGSNFADNLRGGTGNDTLKGGLGLDKLTGGVGTDSLFGGADRDIFDFNALGESKVGSSRDVIQDFKRGNSVTGDDIDLRSIDAKTGVAGDQFFKFIGTQAFHGAKRELHYKDLGATSLVQGDVNGDAKADFEILVKVGTLSAGDFLL